MQDKFKLNVYKEWLKSMLCPYGSLKSKQQNKRKLFSTHHIVHQPWTMKDILIYSHKIVFIGSEQHLCTSFSSITPRHPPPPPYITYYLHIQNQQWTGDTNKSKVSLPHTHLKMVWNGLKIGWLTGPPEGIGVVVKQTFRWKELLLLSGIDNMAFF